MNLPGSPVPGSWAGYLLDGVTAGRKPAQVFVVPTGLRLVTDDGSLWWPFAELRQTGGRYRGEPARFEHHPPRRPVAPGLPAAAPAAIAPAVVVDAPGFLEAVRRVAPGSGALAAPTHRRAFGAALGTAAGLVAVVIGLYAWGLPALSDVAARHVPPAWDAKLGDQVLDQMAPPERRISSGPAPGALQRIVERLRAASGPDPMPFSVTLVRSSTVNAFCAPGGRLVVYTGLLEKTRSPEELAGVLAHEVQHGLHHHPTRMVLRRLSGQALLKIAVGDASSLGSVTSAAGLMGQLAFNRADEAEADRTGLDLLRAAHVDPRAMVAAFEHLGGEPDKVPSAALALISDHPPMAERIATLRRLAAQGAGDPQPLLPDVDWNAVRRAGGATAAAED